jgi:membrane-bound serine protease (ClpP class)
MTLGTILILSFSIGVVLLIAELLLPTHGVLGVGGLLAMGIGIGACFFINRWLGLSVLLGMMLASPLIGSLAIKIYPRTPIGRRMVLQPPSSTPAPLPIHIGQTGVVASALRPMGECDFGDQRIEVISEQGMIPSGQAVKVVSIVNGRPAVRAVS